MWYCYPLHCIIREESGCKSDVAIIHRALPIQVKRRRPFKEENGETASQIGGYVGSSVEYQMVNSI